MNYRSFALVFHFIFFRLALGLSPKYRACQFQKPSGESALTGCPKGTLYVSPSDPQANFSSVQEAINSLPETGRAIILIGEGQYSEVVTVTRSAPLTLLGQLDSTTASISGGNATQRNLVTIWNAGYVENSMADEETATLIVTAATGNSFGSTNFKAYNINFENRAANYDISQALVTYFTYSNVSFYGCTFASFQDTWCTGINANTYVVDSILYGQTDYAYGLGISWFQSSVLANRACGGGITAWAGSPGTNMGAYIVDSRIIRSPDANASVETTELCYLGRPWNENAVAVFLRNYMDESVHPAGFRSWNGESAVPNTTYFAESGSYGPGGSMSARVPQTRILSTAEANGYTLESVFDGSPRWIDAGYEY